MSVCRPYKGHSLNEFPTDITIIDLETTGLNTKNDEIIELSAIRVRNMKIVDRWSSLVHPYIPINNFICNLTGISNELVADAPLLEHILPELLDFIGTDILLGHNVNFDVNFLYDHAEACGLPPVCNDLIDTMYFARKLLPDLPNYKLETLASFFEIPQSNAHRAMADCETTYWVYRHLMECAGQPVSASSEHCQADTRNADDKEPVCSLSGKVFVFVGALEQMMRFEAVELVERAGGLCSSSISDSTNYLVLGTSDPQDRTYSKQRKAEALKAEGQNITIISEDEFYDLLGSRV